MDKKELFGMAEEYIDKIGIAPVERFDGCPAGLHPRDLLPKCQSVIVFCVKHLDIFSKTKNKDCQAYSQDLTKHMMMHGTYKISRFMESGGYKAFPVSGSYRMFPHSQNNEGRISLRHAAQYAGIGHISRIGIIVTPEYGPRVQLGAILTDAVLEPDTPSLEDPCIDCNLCIKICPAGAIRLPEDGEAYLPVDQSKCLEYRAKEGGSSPMGYQRQCALCRSVCPVGKKKL